MTIISSQHFISFETMERKMEELANVDTVIIPCSYVGFIDGVEYAMQNDSHHTLAAARELGINVEFDINSDPDDLEGNDLLEQRYMDGDWYNAETSNPAIEKYDLIW